jgi:uncharacterized membrane protein YedE/YeeE
MFNISSILAAFVSGSVFGVGLAVSGMFDPLKVLGFLDPFGIWDPTLAFVMAGALVITVFAFLRVPKMSSPIWNDTFHMPSSKKIDARLIFGAITFGIGWGLVGLCPGPALANLLLGTWEIFVFVSSMLVGTIIYHLTLGKGVS